MNKAPTDLEYLLDVLTDHLNTLEAVGFGTDEPINGADAVDAVNTHFEDLRCVLATVRYGEET